MHPIFDAGGVSAARRCRRRDAVSGGLLTLRSTLRTGGCVAGVVQGGRHRADADFNCSLLPACGRMQPTEG